VLANTKRQLQTVANTIDQAEVRTRRKALGVLPVYKLIDTCGAEFASETPYFYSTYESGSTQATAADGAEKTESEILPSPRRKIMILGGGPNRIGQGIGFDYCCVPPPRCGCDVIMVNSNPETVSTDFDTSSQLFFEALTLEDVVNIHETQKIDGSSSVRRADAAQHSGRC
jgi:carbamoyl-phosphate synthase large subunit